MIETIAVEGVKPLPIPTMSELMTIASEKARRGSMSAVNFLAQRVPDERDRELDDLIDDLLAAQ